MRIEPTERALPETGEDRRAELARAAQEFEALLVAEVLRNLSDTVSGSSDEAGGGEQLDAILWLELARQLTRERNLGLADAIYRQMAAEEPDPTPVPAPSPKTPTAAPSEPPRLRPVEGHVSSGFGLRQDPLDGTTRFHRGIDVAAREGARVRAPAGGRVVFAGSRGGYGNTVIVEHPSGLQTLYAHLSRIDVREGVRLAPGDRLGAVGQTGRATGPHLHFEVRRGDEALDPRAWMRGALGPEELT